MSVVERRSAVDKNDVLVVTSAGPLKAAAVEGYLVPYTNILPSGVRANTCVLLGDSILNRVYQYTASQNTYDATGFVTWGNILLKQRLLLVNDAGVSGNTTAQCLLRIKTDVLSYAPTYCIVMVGINDITGGISTSVTISNLSSIYSELLSAGIIVIACTLFPSTSVNTDAERAALSVVNNFIRDKASQSDAMILVDTYAAWVDYSNGDPASGMSGDGTHPTYEGGAAGGRALYDALDSVIPYTSRVTSEYSKFASGFLNPNVYGNNSSGANGWTLSTGMTGDGPDNWNASRTGTASGVCSKVASSDWRTRSWLKVAHTGGSDNNRTQVYPADILFQAWTSGGPGTLNRRIRPTTSNGVNYLVTTGGTFASGADPTSSWSTSIGATVTDGSVTMIVVPSMDPGESIFGQMEFAADSFSGGAMLRLTAICYSVSYGSTLYSSYGNYTDTSFNPPTYVPASGIIRTPDFVIPTSTMILRLQMECFSLASVTGNYLVTGAEFRKAFVTRTFQA